MKLQGSTDNTTITGGVMSDETGYTFTCAICQNTFISARSHKNAEQEFKELFPGRENEPCDSVCEACFKLIMPLIKELIEQ
jgi:predicted SprT family Zn-dependent metalloprotease